VIALTLTLTPKLVVLALVVVAGIAWDQLDELARAARRK
jgi:hypothetical protein